jgi:hypothetical protein
MWNLHLNLWKKSTRNKKTFRMFWLGTHCLRLRFFWKIHIMCTFTLTHTQTQTQAHTHDTQSSQIFSGYLCGLENILWPVALRRIKKEMSQLSFSCTTPCKELSVRGYRCTQCVSCVCVCKRETIHSGVVFPPALAWSLSLDRNPYLHISPN